MKRLLFLISIWVCFVPHLYSQDTVHFEIYDGIDDGLLKRTMEQNAARLLTAINIAEEGKSDINYSGIDISNNTVQKIATLWRTVPLHIIDDDIIERCICIKTKNGDIVAYEVRNIKVIIRPLDEGYEGDLNQEVSIYFNREGVICDFNITLGSSLCQDVFKEGRRLDDIGYRMQILHWVEQLYSAYILKDIDLMNAVFSDDVLVITEKDGTLRKILDNSNTFTSTERKYYLSKVNDFFSQNKFINVKFDSIKIVRHPVNSNFYGVTLIQNWNGEKANGSVYADEGTFFSIWDFSDELKPKICVRTWQPMNDPNPIFKLSDFKL